jgi:hypothetical protein
MHSGRFYDKNGFNYSGADFIKFDWIYPKILGSLSCEETSNKTQWPRMDFQISKLQKKEKRDVS